MANFTIYGSNNVAKAVVKELELHDEWMAECYLTISVKSATPIAFAVGDYIDYRGERYTIQYDPNVLKKATSGSYGEGFTYDNIKFVGLQDEVVRCDFNDIVLNDNDIHYSALPTFPFYCESVDDLLDRIQANLEDLYPGQWIIIGLNTVRNAQRGTAVGRAQAFLNAYKQYIDPTGAAHTDPYGKQGVAETADNITCWDAMKKVHDDFDLNFIVRGRVIVVGTAGVFTANTFRYGKGNGLYELERIGESDQRIVTRLRAYGSEQNLPAHYYNTINKQVYATVTSILHKFDTTGADFLLDLDFDRKYFTYRSESYPGTTEAPNYIIEMMANDVTVRGYVTKDATTGKCYVYCESVAGDDDRDEPDATKMAAFVQALTANDRLDFVEYVNKDAFGEGHYDYGTGHLPDNMAVSRLMLPGFPTMSLHAWVQAHKDDADKAWLAQAVADGFTFSNEVYRPYIDSPNKTQYGVRPGSIYFDGSDDTEDVHPTIEGMTYNGAPIDEVYAADQVEDNGVYPAGEEVKNIKITLPVLGFELDKVYEDGASIDMKNGMCGARSFKMAGTPKKDANGRWVCTVERVHDDALDLWFPYCDFQIHGSSETGRQHGDNYVLSGIDMPSAYIEAASVRLLQESIEALKKNHAPRYTYQPRIDELWMQRQHDTAVSSQGVVSLHDTLKAGDIFAFADTDLNIDANVIIDVLTIRENGNNGIPTYEVTLRDEKQVGTIQKITNKVESIISGATQVNGAGGGLTVRQVQSLIDRFGGEQFLSKLNDDTAQGFITMLKGLQVGANFVPDILGEGGVLRMREDGKVELVTDILYARMKAYFDTVEVREYQHTGGNRIASVAGNRICRVEWYNSSNQVLEQTQANLSSVAYFRCYFRASDGEDTVKNNWVVGDMAYCHVTSIANSSDNPEAKGANQKHLWRLVIGRNAEGTLTEDGEAYIDLSNRSTETISSESYAGYQSGSDAPAAQDDIIQLGNVNDTTRQGAIVEFVTGTDAPSYQIYQGINSFSLSNKNQITIGYNTATGKADMKVYGDAYIGARDRSTFIEYKQDDGTQQHRPALNIKAHVEFTNSDAELDTLVQSHQRDDSYDDTEVRSLISGLQDQIDGQVESWFYDYPPVHVDAQGAPDSKVPLNVAPYSDWTTDALKIAHLGDTFTDNSSGYCWRFTRNETTQAFEWTIIEDSAVITALQNAARAQDTADHKRRVFLVQPTPPYDAGDLWVNATYSDQNVSYSNDILKCITSRASGSFNISEWSKASDYTNDDKVNSFISELLNGASDTELAMTAAFKAIRAAMNNGVTDIYGGLVLTNEIEMRDTAATPSVWSGISGIYDSTARGNGVAIWAGGARGDWEAYYDSLTPAQQATAAITSSFAKSLLRFDGSGYLASGNITWDDQGRVAIKDITTIIADNDTDVLNALVTFNNAFHFNTQQGTTTVLSIVPQAGFTALNITENGTLKPVATQEWVGDNYVSKSFFSRLFQAFNGSTAVNVNDLTTTIDNIKAMVDFWSQGGITALGQGSQGGGGGSTTLYGLNDVSENATHDGVLGAADGYVLTFNASTNHWYAAPTSETYVLPMATTSALGGIIVSNALGSQVTLTSGAGTTANRYYGVQIDSVGQAFVNIPWTDTVYTLPAASSTALGGIMIGYNGTTPKTYAVQLDASNKAYVAVNWDDAPTDYWHTGDSRTANTVLAAPNGSNGAATFRALVAADIPALAASKITSGTFDAARIPDLSGTYAAVARVTSLENNFDVNGYANNALRLTTVSQTLFGNTYWTSGGVPTSIGVSGANASLSYVANIEMSGYLQIGSIRIVYDSDNNALKVVKSDNTAANFYATGGVSALGSSGSGGGGGGQGDVTWDLLAANDPRQINQSHLTDALSLALYDYATQAWVQQQGYLTSASLSGYATTSQLAGYLPLSGGNMTGGITLKGSDIYLSTSGSSSDDSGDLVWSYGNGNEKMRIWSQNVYTSAVGPNYRVYSADGTQLYDGQLALKSEIPTNNNQLTNGAGYATQTWVNQQNFANYLEDSGNDADAISNGFYGGKLYGGVHWPYDYYAFLSVGSGNYKMQFNAYSNSLKFRAGDENGLANKEWLTIIHSGNIATQSVSYATSAGSVAWSNITGAPNVVTIGSDGVSEVGQYLDFHYGSSSSDYSVRLEVTSDSHVEVYLPTSDGRLALTSQIPTNNNQLTNGAGYITSSGSCNYATSAGSATNNVEKLAWWSDSDSHDVDDLVSGVTFAYSTHNAPTTGVIASLTGTHNSYQLQLQGQYSGENLYFRNKNGDYGIWNPWRYVIHSGNIGSQSVNYATSAGNSDTLDGYHYNGLPYLPVAQVSENQSDYPNWVRSYAVSHRQSFVYNTSGREWAYWIGMRSSDTQFGTILRLSHDGLVQYMYKAGGADDAGWSDWKDIITQNNIGSQSVSYASTTSLMTIDNSIAYGRSGLQFAQSSGSVGTDPTIFQNPENDWYSHIIMNHSNSAGYYVDLAFCFHSDDFRFRRVSSGSGTSWGSFITSSNIGSQSVNYATSAGNSDTVDGLHSYSLARQSDGVGTNANDIQDGLYGGKLYSAANWPLDYYAFLSAGYGNYKLQFNARANVLYFRSGAEDTIDYAWKQVAFTDSNVASATKLATSRSIWGQSFDGTADVSGSLYLSGYLYMSHGGTWYSTIDNDGNGPIFGYGQSVNGRCAYYTGNPVYITGYHSNYATGITVTSANNVGIGTTSPSYKLHVNGESYFENWMYVNSSVTAQGFELQPSSSSAGHGGHIDFHYNRSSSDYTTRLIEDASGRLKLIGDFYATGGVTALVATSSDIRKKNVVSYDLPLTLNQIADAPTIKFTWKDKPNLGEQVGSIAQYWQKVLPQTIRTEKDNTLSLQYGVAALVSAITTARKVVDHEKRISELEKECKRLKTENEQLKMMIA